MTSTKSKRKITGSLKQKSQKKLGEDHRSQIQALDEALKVCEKYFYDDIEFEFKGMKVKIKQEGAKIKAIHAIAKNFEKTMEISRDDLNKLMEMFR